MESESLLATDYYGVVIFNLKIIFNYILIYLIRIHLDVENIINKPFSTLDINSIMNNFKKYTFLLTLRHTTIS